MRPYGLAESNKKSHIDYPNTQMLKESIKYIKSDYFRYTGRYSSIFRILLFLFYAHNHAFNFQFWLRLASGGGGSILQDGCIGDFLPNTIWIFIIQRK